MQTHYLSFANEQEANAILVGEAWLEENQPKTPKGFIWDAIGAIVLKHAVVNLLGVELSAEVRDNHHHVNLYDLEDSGCPEVFADFVIPAPSNPRRILGRDA